MKQTDFKSHYKGNKNPKKTQFLRSILLIVLNILSKSKSNFQFCNVKINLTIGKL